MDFRNVSLLGLFLYFISIVTGEDLARGWNNNIDWLNFDDGLKASKAEQKPMMLLIHKSWCGACKKLKPKFAEDKQIEELSKNFIMVNTLDEEEPTEKQYSPDGGYIPRILFLDSEGKVDTSIVNKFGNPNYRYFYPVPTAIIDSMKTAVAKFSSAPRRGADEL